MVDDEGLDIHGQVHELLDPDGRHGLALFQARSNRQLLFRRALVIDRAGRQRHRLGIHGGVKSVSSGVVKPRVIEIEGIDRIYSSASGCSCGW